MLSAGLYVTSWERKKSVRKCLNMAHLCIYSPRRAWFRNIIIALRVMTQKLITSFDVASQVNKHASLNVTPGQHAAFHLSILVQTPRQQLLLLNVFGGESNPMNPPSDIHFLHIFVRVIILHVNKMTSFWGRERVPETPHEWVCMHVPSSASH